MTLPPPDPTEPAPVEPVVTPPTTPDAAADPFTTPVDMTDVAMPVAPLASVSPAEPRREGRRFGSPVLVMVALFAFAVGIFVDRGLTAVGSLDLSGVTAGAPTPVPAGSAGSVAEADGRRMRSRSSANRGTSSTRSTSARPTSTTSPWRMPPSTG